MSMSVDYPKFGHFYFKLDYKGKKNYALTYLDAQFNLSIGYMFKLAYYHTAFTVAALKYAHF